MRIVYHGVCPLCNHRATERSVILSTGERSRGLYKDNINKHELFQCLHCYQYIPGKPQTTELFSKRKRRPAALLSIDNDFVNYGVLQRLERSSGRKLSETFYGDIDALAKRLNLSDEQIIENWNFKDAEEGLRYTMDELRAMGKFMYSA